jgi:glycosyltransferase involved in cell wall biosynthesis
MSVSPNAYRSQADLGERPLQPLSMALMIETVGLGGAEMVVLQLAESLRARGHRVTAVVPGGREGWLLDELHRADFEVSSYDLRRAIDSGFPARLARQLKGIGAEVIHSHEFVMAVYGAAAARLLKRPHVITMHGNQGMADKLQRRVALRWAFRNSGHVVAVSEDTRRHLETALGIRSGRLQVIPNGIPVRPGDRRLIRGALSLRESDVLMLSVGSLSPRKGHAILLEALILLQAGGFEVPWQLAIVGEGPERPRLEELIVKGRLDGRAHLLGKRTDIPDLQAAADVFVLPSLWEGLPLVILEAMFGGNAIVASDISGVPEAIDHEKHGILVPAGDPAALAAALGSVLRDPEYRRRLADAAVERARREFTIDVMTSAYERLYRAR